MKNIRLLIKKACCLLTMSCMASALMFVSGLGLGSVQAAQLSLSFSSTDGSACSDISDGDYFTTEYFDPGTQITISSGTPIDSLYVVWENLPGSWTLKINGKSYTYGTEGFLHEFVRMPQDAGTVTSVTLEVENERITIADIYAFSVGELPEFVQTWEEPYEKADVLLISTHADDEVLFFGGIIPNYTDRGDVRVQVAYFTDQFLTEPYRNHEILNGLWKMGVDHYPQLGEFYDYYSESIEEAQDQYNYDSGLEYIVRTIRRFKPQVVIGQDPENGEYGHGGHIWCASLIRDALEITGNAERYTDSAQRFGTWDVPKTYFHLYPENGIELDARTALASFGGKTELEVAKEAYLEHQSQQWCWFYVSDGYDEEGNPDGYEYSCTKYGLYKSLVGADTQGNDILENIVTYDAQERKAAEEESKAREAALAAAEKEQPAPASEETPSAQSVLDENVTTAVPGGKNTTILTILIIIAVILAIIIIWILVVSRSRAKLRKEEQRLEKSRRDAEARARGRYRTTVNRNPSAYRTVNTPNRGQTYRSQSPVNSSARTGSAAGRTASGSSVRRSSNGSYSQRTTRNDSGSGYRR
ncbi:MAG: PIG-L family deacetylase [Parasporobacterium sp.]|nr:PIG-L family deacetylase [Parasporobacterium sp.]MBQ9031091.1 PIG-L family deacetylase [Parasporobacterium sp.]